MWKCYKCPCKFSFSVNVFFFIQIVYCKEKTFFQAFRSIANKSCKWYVTNSVYVAIAIFVPGRKKRTRNLLFAYVGVHISCKMMHIKDAYAMARIGLKTNSSGDVSLGKEEAPLLK